MARGRHPNRDIEEAVQYAEAHGWKVVHSGKSAHSWAKIRCPHNDRNCRNGMHCQNGIWSTPRDPRDHARHIRQWVDRCIHTGDCE